MNEFPAGDASAWAKVDDIVRGTDCFFIVLDDDDGTVGLVGKAGLLMATAFAILAM